MVLIFSGITTKIQNIPKETNARKVGHQCLCVIVFHDLKKVKG